MGSENAFVRMRSTSFALHVERLPTSIQSQFKREWSTLFRLQTEIRDYLIAKG